MTNERAIEILNPAHREHYDSIETVNEACRIGMDAIKRLTPTRPVEIEEHFDDDWEFMTMTISRCPDCGKRLYRKDKFCLNCGQALDWGQDSLEEEMKWYANCKTE